MSKLYAIRQTGKSNYWYDFIEDFTSSELDRNCISNNFTYVKECQNSLADLNPAWKNSEIVEFRELGDLDDFEDLYYKSIEQRKDLEAKLAESEEYNKMLLEEKGGYIDLVSGYSKKCKNYEQQLKEITEKYNACQEARKQEIEFNQQDKRELKQQLTDKIQKYQLLDDNYTRLTEKYDLLESRHELLIEENLKLEHQLAEKNEAHTEAMQNALNDFLKLRQELNQNKIYFAVEKLEKVKENIKKVPITDFDLSGNFEKMYKQDAIRQIDNQIKQLKEGK